MRILGLDFGQKTIGAAVSDSLGWTAQGVEIIRREEEDNLKGSIARLKQLCEEYGIEYIVLGYPKNMNNTIGERAAKTVRFKKRLKKELKLPVKLWDERLSTVAAERDLLEADVSRRGRKEVIDKMAAVFILQGYLDFLAAENKKEKTDG